MKWYQAHLRVMSRLFELGFFDEVNSCYRNFALHCNPSDQEQLMSLVIDHDIKLYCTALSAEKLAKKSLNTSKVMTYYYKATAGFTMFKALQEVDGTRFDRINVSDDMPYKHFQVLFDESGVLKEDVVINAFKSQTFNSTPQGFVGNFLRFNHKDYLNDQNFRLCKLTGRSVFDDVHGNFTSKEAQELISQYDYTFSRALEARNKEQSAAPKKASKSQKINYFHINSELDSSFALLKIIDLLGIHLLLVALRREYLFSCLGYDDLRSNYKALELVNSNDIVRLHNHALTACQAFEEARTKLLSNNGQVDNFNIIVNAYVGRNDALYQYICYFCDLFTALQPNYNCTNRANSWEVEYCYFNLYEPFMHLSYLQAKLLDNVNKLISIDLSLIKGLAKPLAYDQELVNIVLGSIPANISELCAHFAPSFKNDKLSHPSLVKFEDIVNSVMSYSKSLIQVSPKLPYPIKEDSEYDIEDCGDPSWLKRGQRDIGKINEKLAYEVISDLKPIVFSSKLNVYRDMFSLLSCFVELLNDFYLRSTFSVPDKLKNVSDLRLEFDLAYCDQDVAKLVYPVYELLLKDDTFSKLIECHQDCFEQLVLILDLQGQSHLLYEDSYLSNLLRKTNNYDQELSESFAHNNSSSNSLDKPTLSKAEQLLLNKTCIAFVQACNKFCEISKEFLSKSNELDIILDEKLEKFIFRKTDIFEQKYRVLLMPIRVLGQNAILNLDNVPEDLKVNAVIASNNGLINDELGIKLNQSFYQCFYETLLVLSAKDINRLVKDFVPYINFATKEAFAQSLSCFCLISKSWTNLTRTDFVTFITFKRLLQSYSYDQAIYQQICHNAFFVNSALSIILAPYSLALVYIMIPLVKYFVRIVLSITKIKQVEEFADCLNMVYNMVLKLTKFMTSNPAKVQNLKALTEQGNAVLCERFEYKSYLLEIVDLLSLYESMCLKYNSFDSDFGIISEICDISLVLKLYKDLLEDTPAVLQCIDMHFLKRMATESHVDIPYFNGPDYISIDEDFVHYIMAGCGERLSQPQLSVAAHFFGNKVSATIETEDYNFHGDEEDDFFFPVFSRRKPKVKAITKSNLRIINLVIGKMRVLDDDEMHQVLSLDSQKILTQIVDSTSSDSTGSQKSKASTKSKTGTTTKSRAKKATTSSATEVSADEATNATDATDVKPKKKATRAKKATTTDATASVADSTKASPELEVEAKTDGAAKSTTKAKTTTKATATKSKAKKVATATSTEANADSATEETEATDAKPKKKASTARTTSKASSSTRAKKSAVNS